ncbi:hypothetical protein [Leucobacter sp. GX24907]
MTRFSASTERSDRSTVPADDRLSGAGRVLIVVYGILAIAATFRSVYQILTKFDEAPLAYVLSAVAGLVYIFATIALSRRGAKWARIARICLVFELVGVLVVGTLSFVVPQWFAHPSVWSWFGAGYLCIPLVLPILGLIWLRRRSLAGQDAR